MYIYKNIITKVQLHSAGQFVIIQQTAICSLGKVAPIIPVMSAGADSTGRKRMYHIYIYIYISREPTFA